MTDGAASYQRESAWCDGCARSVPHLRAVRLADGWHGDWTCAALASTGAHARGPLSADRIDPRGPPGAALICGSDPGGVRWFLDGRPVHAGTGIELLVGIDPTRCGCGGDGCLLCGGACWRYSPLWLRCRFETGRDDDGAPIGWLHLPVHGASSRVLAAPSMRCRWPTE